MHDPSPHGCVQKVCVLDFFVCNDVLSCPAESALATSTKNVDGGDDDDKEDYNKEDDDKEDNDDVVAVVVNTLCGSFSKRMCHWRYTQKGMKHD